MNFTSELIIAALIMTGLLPVVRAGAADEKYTADPGCQQTATADGRLFAMARLPGRPSWEMAP